MASKKIIPPAAPAKKSGSSFGAFIKTVKKVTKHKSFK